MTDVDKSAFTIISLEDEIRVDGLSRKLLKDFHHNLLKKGTPPLEAGAMAHGADYFVRDFVISARYRNLFEEKPGIVRLFAATWYIISTIEPKIDEIQKHLRGVREFYRFLHAEGLISPEYLGRMEEECNDIALYEERIESFLDITDDGYISWERKYSLKQG